MPDIFHFHQFGLGNGSGGFLPELRILQHFVGVITNKGTRVSRAAEVLVIMDKPGVLGTKNATELLHSGSEAQIVCWGNEASVYLVDEKAR